MSFQRGTGLLTKNAPKFAGHVVVRDTWKEKDATEHLRTDGGESERVNDTFFNPGVDVTCDVVIKKGESPVILKKGDILTELSPGTRVFLVMDVDSSGFGPTPLKQSLQLSYTEGYDPDLVADE